MAEGADSTPTIPAGVHIYLGRRTRADMMSLEFSQERVAKAAGLLDMKRRAEEANTKASNVLRHLEASQEKLTKANAKIGTDKDDVDGRMGLEARVKVLNEDYRRLSMAATGETQGVMATERELQDGLVQWAEARRDVCREAIPVF